MKGKSAVWIECGTLASLLTTHKAVCDSVLWGWEIAGFVKASTYSGNRNITPSKRKSCRNTRNGICCLFSCQGAEEGTQNPQPLLLSQTLAPYWGILGPAEAATAEPRCVPQHVREDQKGPWVLAMASWFVTRVSCLGSAWDELTGSPPPSALSLQM